MKQSKLFQHYAAHNEIDDQPLYRIAGLIYDRVRNRKDDLDSPLIWRTLRQQTGVELYFRYDYIDTISVSDKGFHVTLSNYDNDTISIRFPDSLVFKIENGEDVTHDVNLMVDKWITEAITEAEKQVAKDAAAALKKKEDEKTERYRQFLRLKEEFGE